MSDFLARRCRFTAVMAALTEEVERHMPIYNIPIRKLLMDYTIVLSFSPNTFRSR